MDKKCVEYSSSQPTKRLKIENVKDPTDLKWKYIKRNNLDLSLVILFDKVASRDIFSNLEKEIEYLTGELAQVKVFGKVYPIPRKQAAYGEKGLTYKYSGTTIVAKEWTQTLQYLVDRVHAVTGFRYNFALINRYKDGSDKMGYHKDDEKELDKETPIASLTFGAERDFIFRHQDKKAEKIEDEKFVLTDGLLLLMNPPTNNYWYHSLPPRKSCKETRINITFRKVLSR